MNSIISAVVVFVPIYSSHSSASTVALICGYALALLSVCAAIYTPILIGDFKQGVNSLVEDDHAEKERKRIAENVAFMRNRYPRKS